MSVFCMSSMSRVQGRGKSKNVKRSREKEGVDVQGTRPLGLYIKQDREVEKST